MKSIETVISIIAFIMMAIVLFALSPLLIKLIEMANHSITSSATKPHGKSVIRPHEGAKAPFEKHSIHHDETHTQQTRLAR